MRKYFFCVITFLAVAFPGRAQNGDIDQITGTLIPKTKDVVTNINGQNYFSLVDTGFTLVIVLNTTNISLSEKLVLKLGKSQDSSEVINLRYKFLDHGISNNRCAHIDDVSSYEVTDIKNGRLQLYFDILLSDVDKLKWITAYVKNGNSQSQKKYYEFN